MAVRFDEASRRVDPGHGTERRGTVLVVVLVVIALLSFGAYSFSELMLSEAEATAMYGRGVEARAFAESGIEHAAACLGTRTGYGMDNFHNNPELFQGVLMRQGNTDRGIGRFSLVAADENDAAGRLLRFGITDESGKLNLNALTKFKISDEERQAMLMSLPGMTVEIADAVLDWIDADETPRTYGVESEYYLGLAPPYLAKNGPLESLEELLLVRGMTAAMLFGEDANRNGLLDANENDGDDTPPFDNQDAVLDPGWSAFLTVSSREANRRIDGTPRTNLNHGLLTELYDQLEPEFGPDMAKFIIAYRVFGPSQGGSSGQSSGSSGRSSSGSSSGGSGSGSDASPEVQQAAQALAQALFGGSSQGGVSRGGVDLASGGKYSINSIYDLVGATVIVNSSSQNSKGSSSGGGRGGSPGGGSDNDSDSGNGNGPKSNSGRNNGGGSSNSAPQEVLQSPWAADPASMVSYLPDLMDRFATTDTEFVVGRVNVNTARPEVLMGIPGMTEQTLDAIVASRTAAMVGASPDAQAGRATTGWLVAEGIVSLEQMRKFDPYLTTQGDVYRVESVGYFDAGGPLVRLEALIDAGQLPARVVFLRDLSHLGRGYAREQLTPTSDYFLRP